MSAREVIDNKPKALIIHDAIFGLRVLEELGWKKLLEITLMAKNEIGNYRKLLYTLIYFKLKSAHAVA